VQFNGSTDNNDCKDWTENPGDTDIQKVSKKCQEPNHNLVPHTFYEAPRIPCQPLAGAREEWVGSGKYPVLVRSRRWTRRRVRPFSPRNLAKDEPPGRLRVPCRKANSTNFQARPGASGIGPERMPGQLPVRAWWASAQARMPRAVKGSRSRAYRAPRS
jgi:hypothetical protein